MYAQQISTLKTKLISMITGSIQPGSTLHLIDPEKLNGPDVDKNDDYITLPVFFDDNGECLRHIVQIHQENGHIFAKGFECFDFTFQDLPIQSLDVENLAMVCDRLIKRGMITVPAPLPAFIIEVEGGVVHAVSTIDGDPNTTYLIFDKDNMEAEEEAEEDGDDRDMEQRVEDGLHLKEGERCMKVDANFESQAGPHPLAHIKLHIF